MAIPYNLGYKLTLLGVSKFERDAMIHFALILSFRPNKQKNPAFGKMVLPEYVRSVSGTFRMFYRINIEELQQILSSPLIVDTFIEDL